MKFESETSFVGPINIVLEVLGSKALLQKRLEELGARGKVEYDGTTTAHTFRAFVPNSELPAAARSFLPNGLKALLHGQVTELTGLPRGACLAYDVTIEGAPASGSLTYVLGDGGATTPAKITGDINVKIPFVGGRIEKAAIERAGKVLSRDVVLVNEEIARVRSENQDQ